MAILKSIEIDGKPVQFRASAAIPRIYRLKFRRDIFDDLNKLSKTLKKNIDEGTEFDSFSLETFENIAYIMAKYADPTVPDSVEAWLDEFETFSIYAILPELIELWGMNVETQVESKKNFDRLTAR